AGTHTPSAWHSTRSTSAANIDDGERCRSLDVGHGMAECTRKPIGVRPEENTVRRFGRKRGVHEQLLVERRKSHLGAEQIPVDLQLFRLLEQANHCGRQLNPLK